jgi:hypothetical protein
VPDQLDQCAEVKGQMTEDRGQKKLMALRAGAAIVFASLAVAGLSLPARAQEAPPSAFGRLFFTPERRQALDRQRQFNMPEKDDVSETPMLSIDGVVVRSDGRRIVWINGHAHDETRIGAHIRMEDPAQVLIHSGVASPAEAKVGDTLSRDTGEAAGLLKGGKVTRDAPSADPLR